MKLVNCTFENLEKLDSFIDINLQKTKNLFIQLLSSTEDFELIQSILNLLAKKLPHAKIIGSSTAGEIVHGKIYRDTIQISFSIFEDTKIQTYHYDKSNYEVGLKAAKECLKQDTKAVIAFSETFKGDSEAFLNGFTALNNNIPIAGGNAGDNSAFEKTFIIQDTNIYFDGIVLATLNNKNLNVSSNFSLEWTPVGREMLITKANNNIIYEIDNKPVSDIFSFYLGEETILNLPDSANKFPLVKVENGVNIARAIVDVTSDDAFIFAGHFQNGDKVRFAIGNVEDILNNASIIQNEIAKKPVQATYIYSCSVRHDFLQEQLNHEFELIEKIAPSVGMLTYGEFFHFKHGNKLLNITTTTLSISENKSLSKNRHISKYSAHNSMLKSLTHLVNISQDELDHSINILNQYKNILDESCIVSKTDANGIITYVNDAFCAISGYSQEYLMGQRHEIIQQEQNDSKKIDELWNTIKSKKIWRGRINNISKDGNEYYVKSVAMPILNDNGDIVEFISASTDVTELIKKDKIIKKQLTDKLTGLQNREALLEALEIKNEQSTLALINIDRFSDINDYFGYQVGDKVLQNIAKIMQKTIKIGSTYRLSSDEFAVLYLNKIMNPKIIAEIASLTENIENTNLKIDGHKILPIISCGLSSGINQDIYQFSHIAIKESKVNSKKIVIYNECEYLQTQTKNNIEMIDTIKTGIKEDCFLPFYQGIVDNKTKKIVKYEALIRLKHRDGSIAYPGSFLNHAKKSKLYSKLTQIMIEKTFQKFEKLEYEFSINLCLQDILSTTTKNVLFENLKKYKCGNRVVIEIVESEGIENFQELDLFIKEVKKFNCKLAIDDFGTGYSNFRYLTKLNIDYIKIDGSLVNNIDTDMSQRATVESILLFAKNMNIKTIAEYVETQSIFNTLVQLGIDYSQGYLFSEPCEELK